MARLSGEYSGAEQALSACYATFLPLFSSLVFFHQSTCRPERGEWLWECKHLTEEGMDSDASFPSRDRNACGLHWPQATEEASFVLS